MSDPLEKYRELFQQTLNEVLTKAIEYLLKHNVAKTHTEIAKKMNVSLPTLTGYMKGTKQISKSFQINFEKVYHLDLTNPVTYREDDIVDKLILSDLPDISSTTYLIAYRTFQKIIREQQMVIEGLKTANKGLSCINEELYNYILVHQQGIIMNTIDKQLS